MKTLKDIRLENQLTQEELSQLLDISVGTVYNLEKDSTRIKDEVVKKYMRAFGIKYDDIFLGNEYENNVFRREKKDELKKQIASKLKTAI